ncbi:S8 family serine peptidase [Xanthobacteraceae bacterium A53D]
MPDEIVTLGLSTADLGALTGQGWQVLQEAPAGLPGITLRRLRIPQGVSLLQARDTVRALPSGSDADFNHFYRRQQSSMGDCRGAHCSAWEMVGWSEAAAEACSAGVSVGMVDTGFDPGHAAFAGRHFELHRLASQDQAVAPAAHGTAVAALLVGAPGSRAPGLLPRARLVAVDVFHRSGRDERADLFSLLQGLDLVAARGVRVVNLSMAGPANLALEQLIARLMAERGLLLVAATGNAGHQAPPAYPAAYPGVIAVTALDRNGAVYRRAGRGAHVDFAAPGVDIPAAGPGAARSGTSFAAPFVAAAAALAVTRQPDLKGEAAVVAALAEGARDFGTPGRDDIFGHGVPQLERFCTAAAVMPAAVR